MHSLNNLLTSLITFERLTAKQLEQLVAAFEERPMSVTTHTLPARNKDPRMVDYTFTCFIASSDYLNRQEIQILEKLCLTNAVLSFFITGGKRVGQRLEWFDTHQMTLMAWLDTAGLLKKENLSKSNHH